MTKAEIKKKIFEMQSDEEITNFINERLKELEEDSVEKVVGQNYTDSFQDYISSKMHYKAAENFKDSECPDLVYDDIKPYFNLVKSIKKNGGYNELTLFTTIFFVVCEYLPSGVLGFDRYTTYSLHKNKRLSIKAISENEVAFCSEKAGMAHNMFKFLGIDSEVICGARETDMHAYNFIYPNGYGNEPMILYDPSFFVNFINGDKKSSFGFFIPLHKQEYEILKSGKPIQIDLTRTEKLLRKFFNLDDYILENETPTYVFGLENAKKYLCLEINTNEVRGEGRK